MLTKHKIKEAPSWQRKLVLLLGSLTAATFLLFMVWAVMLFIQWARVDDCLAHGGSYDYAHDKCDFESTHPIPED